MLPKDHLGRDGSMAVVESLAWAGFRKLNFAGGEPTLCHGFQTSSAGQKHLGLTTSVVTNGSLISGEWLDRVPGQLDRAPSA